MNLLTGHIEDASDEPSSERARAFLVSRRAGRRKGAVQFWGRNPKFLFLAKSQWIVVHQHVLSIRDS